MPIFSPVKKILPIFFSPILIPIWTAPINVGESAPITTTDIFFLAQVEGWCQVTRRFLVGGRPHPLPCTAGLRPERCERDDVAPVPRESLHPTIVARTTTIVWVISSLDHAVAVFAAFFNCFTWSIFCPFCCVFSLFFIVDFARFAVFLHFFFVVDFARFAVIFTDFHRRFWPFCCNFYLFVVCFGRFSVICTIMFIVDFWPFCCNAPFFIVDFGRFAVICTFLLSIFYPSEALRGSWAHTPPRYVTITGDHSK